MIDLIVNAIIILGIVVVSVPVILFAVLGVVHMAYGVYKLTSED